MAGMVVHGGMSIVDMMYMRCCRLIGKEHPGVLDPSLIADPTQRAAVIFVRDNVEVARAQFMTYLATQGIVILAPPIISGVPIVTYINRIRRATALAAAQPMPEALYLRIYVCMYMFYSTLRYLKMAFEDGNNMEVVQQMEYIGIWLENVQIRAFMWFAVANLAPAAAGGFQTQIFGDLIVMAIRDVRTAMANISASRGPSPTTAVNAAQSRLQLNF